MIKCVIFDLDDTLYNYVAAHTVAFKALSDYAASELGIPGDRFSALHRDMFRKLSSQMGNVAACHNRLIRYENILEDNSIPYYPHLLKMYDIYWETLLDNSVPSPGALKTLKALKDLGIRTGIGTDMTARMQFKKLDRMGMLPYVDFMVSSEEACAEKPSAGFFDLCAAKSRCERSECLFVGDSRRKDAEGAIRAGMNGLWYCPEGVITLSSSPAPDNAVRPGSKAAAEDIAAAAAPPILKDLADIPAWIRTH